MSSVRYSRVDQLTADERLAEVAEILAAGLSLSPTRQSSLLTAGRRDSPLDYGRTVSTDAADARAVVGRP